jgi:hypothetical protein
MRLPRTILAGLVACLSVIACVAVADELPACESDLKPKKTFTPDFTLGRCIPLGKAQAVFTVKTNGHTTDVVVEVVEASGGKKGARCLANYAESIAQRTRFPDRASPCRHAMPISIKEL